MMPNMTDIAFRPDYQLYAGKPCLDEDAVRCRGCIEKRILSIGETVNWNARGDSPHWGKR